MVNWIAGQTDRFRCLVTHDGNIDERTAYLMTEELWFPEWEHGGMPWTNPEGFAKHDPIDHIGNWKTPTLVIHGGKDYRVVYSTGARHLHRPPEEGRTLEAPLLPRREPLGPEARRTRSSGTRPSSAGSTSGRRPPGPDPHGPDRRRTDVPRRGPRSRDEGGARGARRSGGRGRRRGPEGARRPLRRPPRVRHRRPARAGGGRPRPDEPRGRDQGHARARLLAPRPARARRAPARGRRRLRRPLLQPPVRRGHRRRPRRPGHPRASLPRSRAHAVLRLRGAAAQGRGRR